VSDRRKKAKTRKTTKKTERFVLKVISPLVSDTLSYCDLTKVDEEEYASMRKKELVYC